MAKSDKQKNKLSDKTSKKTKRAITHKPSYMYNGYLGEDGVCISCISRNCKDCPYEKKVKQEENLWIH
ncbi:MAG: hypothetical protein SPF92_08495 [Clostridia bacterium]|nr:hypothetical protein [Clostridia bacterium]